MGRPEPAIYEEPSDDEPGVFDVYDEAFEAARDAEAIADLEAGRFVSHEAVKRWVLSWGTDRPHSPCRPAADLRPRPPAPLDRLGDASQ